MQASPCDILAFLNRCASKLQHCDVATYQKMKEMVLEYRKKKAGQCDSWKWS